MKKDIKMVMRLAKLTQESMVSGLSERHLVSGGMKMISNGNVLFVDAHTLATITDTAPLVELTWRFTKVTNLQRIRKDRGLTQKELANKSGINIRMVQHYEQGMKDINKANAITVYKLACALTVDMGAILELQEVE